MRAFVLSGGGNFGALQVGALQALLDRGIQPDMLVGTSAGALNAAWFAGDPTPNGVRQLARLWTHYAPRMFTGRRRLAALYHLAHTRQSILPNQAVSDLVSRWLPANARFVDFSNPRLYAVASRLDDGSVRVFGDEPEDLLLDGLMASTALPPLFPPWYVNGDAYVDGGVSANLPLRVALERGADEIYALQICANPDGNRKPEGFLPVCWHSINVMISQQVRLEIEVVRREAGLKLHLISLCPDIDTGFWNFDHAAGLICDGFGAVEAYFRQNGHQFDG